MQKGKVSTVGRVATAAPTEKKPPHLVPGEKDDKGKMLANSSEKKELLQLQR
jgi:hypothetical protein